MADVVFTSTVTGRRNLGGGALIAYGTIAADTGDYVTGGVVVSGTTFKAMDQVSNREPDVVLWQDADGYKWNYDVANSLLELFALNLDGNALVNGVYAEHTQAAVAAGVGVTAKFVAFWFPKVP